MCYCVKVSSSLMLAAAQSVFNTLRQMPSLTEFSDEALHLLASVGHQLSKPSGSVIFSEGDYHSQLYLVSSGTVRLDMKTAKCGRQTILSIGMGDFLAWSALIGDGVMTSTAIAADDVELVALNTESLQQLLQQHHDLGYLIMRALAKSLSRRLLATRLQLLDLYHP